MYIGLTNRPIKIKFLRKTSYYLYEEMLCLLCKLESKQSDNSLISFAWFNFFYNACMRITISNMQVIWHRRRRDNKSKRNWLKWGKNRIFYVAFTVWALLAVTHNMNKRVYALYWIEILDTPLFDLNLSNEWKFNEQFIYSLIFVYLKILIERSHNDE